MKFGIIATLLVATCVAAISGDVSETLLKSHQSPARPEKLNNIFKAEIANHKYMNGLAYQTNSDNEIIYHIRFQDVPDPTELDDDSIILAEDGLLQHIIVGNLTGCSARANFSGLSFFHNIPGRVVTLPSPSPVKLEGEIRANEFLLHGHHLVDLSLMNGEAAVFNLSSYGEFQIALSRGFAGFTVHFNPLPKTDPVKIVALQLNLGFESFTINSAETVLNNGPEPVDWASVNRDIRIIFDTNWPLIKNRLEEVGLTVVKILLKDCTALNLISGKLSCIDLFELRNPELIAQCQDGPSLPEVPGELSSPPTSDPGMGPTVTTSDDGSSATTPTTTTESLAHASSLILASIIMLFFLFYAISFKNYTILKLLWDFLKSAGF